MTIVDTSVWIDVLRGSVDDRAVWVQRHIEDPEMGLTDLTLSEVLQGIRSNSKFDAVRHDLLGIGVYSTGGAELAIESASRYRFLRGRGVTVRSTIDCLIATYCIVGSHSLLHMDRDYDPFERYLGLRVVRP